MSKLPECCLGELQRRVLLPSIRPQFCGTAQAVNILGGVHRSTLSRLCSELLYLQIPGEGARPRRRYPINYLHLFMAESENITARRWLAKAQDFAQSEIASREEERQKDMLTERLQAVDQGGVVTRLDVATILSIHREASDAWVERGEVLGDTAGTSYLGLDTLKAVLMWHRGANAEPVS